MSKHRAYIFTLNNYTKDDVARLSVIECKYVVYGYEVAPTTGTPHLQGYLVFHNPRAFTAVAKEFAWHIEVARGDPQQNFDYSTKTEGEYYERGTRPPSKKEQGAREKADWDTYRLAAREGRFDDIPSSIYIRNQTSFKRIRAEDQPKPQDLPHAEHYGIWIYGPPRTGKSHHARNTYPDAYLKDANKWWCGYTSEDVVIIDEFEPSHARELTSLMKKWTDRWTFTAEKKNGRMIIRPKLIVITSNFSIDECFTGVQADAIKARFQIMHMTVPYQL